MLDIVLTIVFGVLAVRIAQTIRRESAIFLEFNQSRSLAYLVLLFPLGPTIYLFTVFRLGWLIAVVASAACYMPALVVARRRLAAFDRAGTDRVKKAQSAASLAFGAAVAGLVYVGVALVFALIGAAG